MLDCELLRAEEQGSLRRRGGARGIGDGADLGLTAETARRNFDPEPASAGVEQAADQCPVCREGQSGAERAAPAVG
jgi:hypothetical protein